MTHAKQVRAKTKGMETRAHTPAREEDTSEGQSPAHQLQLWVGSRRPDRLDHSPSHSNPSHSCEMHQHAASMQTHQGHTLPPGMGRTTYQTRSTHCLVHTHPTPTHNWKHRSATAAQSTLLTATCTSTLVKRHAKPQAQRHLGSAADKHVPTMCWQLLVGLRPATRALPV